MNRQQPTASGGRLRRPAEIATIAGAVFAGLGVLIALLAWQWPTGSKQSGTADPGTPTPTSGTATSQPAAPPQQSAATRFLTEMTPSAGQPNIEIDRGNRTFVFQCGSGVSDSSREVTYQLRGSYHKFDANVVVSEVAAPEVQTQLQAFADGVRVSNVVIDGKSSLPVSTSELNGAEVLTLRLTCERRDTVVVVEQARVSS